MYRLFTLRQVKTSIAVIGCGGTGGFVAEGLCRFLPASMQLQLVDHDRVEERNLYRQNFYHSDLGRFKSEALAQRLSEKFDRPIAYSTLPFSALGGCPDLMIGCVDNGRARQDIAELINNIHFTYNYYMGWWVDAGNGANYGQVLIGNRPLMALNNEAFESCQGICYGLPLPTIQSPGLLLELPPAPSCAEAVAQDEQSPTINQCMAALVLEAVHRILTGTCPWMQLYVDMSTGNVRSVFATPEAVADITGIASKELVHEEKMKERR
jgi:hypothetical protein